MARSGEIRRATKETDLHVRVDLDGKGDAHIHTGIGFFKTAFVKGKLYPLPGAQHEMESALRADPEIFIQLLIIYELVTVFAPCPKVVRNIALLGDLYYGVLWFSGE